MGTPLPFLSLIRSPSPYRAFFCFVHQWAVSILLAPSSTQHQTKTKNLSSILFDSHPYESSEVFAFFTKNHSLKGIQTLFFFFHVTYLMLLQKFFKKRHQHICWGKAGQRQSNKDWTGQMFPMFVVLSSPPVNISQNYETCSLKNSF